MMLIVLNSCLFKALGEFDESNLEELKRLTNGEPVVFWNLGYDLRH